MKVEKSNIETNHDRHTVQTYISDVFQISKVLNNKKVTDNSLKSQYHFFQFSNYRLSL